MQPLSEPVLLSAPIQTALTGLIVLAAAVYLVWKFTAKGPKKRKASKGPDVPTKALLRKK